MNNDKLDQGDAFTPRVYMKRKIMRIIVIFLIAILMAAILVAKYVPSVYDDRSQQALKVLLSGIRNIFSLAPEQFSLVVHHLFKKRVILKITKYAFNMN